MCEVSNKAIEKRNVFNFYRKKSVNYMKLPTYTVAHMYAKTIHFISFFLGGAHLSSVKSGMGFHEKKNLRSVHRKKKAEKWKLKERGIRGRYEVFSIKISAEKNGV
jgi:hypothetical protein